MSLFAVATLLISLSVACTETYPYRWDTTENCACTPSYCPCSILSTEAYDLAFVEFDDYGHLSNTAQRERLQALLDTYEAQDVLILVFIHGWRHNADNDDEHVQEFQTLLGEMHPIEEVRASEQPRTPRRILGVYVGWQGLSWAIEPLSLLTFGARQAKARAIGSGQLYELLLDLEGYRNAKNGREGGTRLIIAGHSLGASILYHAVSHDLRRRLHVRRQQSEIVPPFGDLFLLLHPALTTGEFQLLRDAAIEGQPYPPNQAPVMLTALSVSDDTIKRWYHLDGLRASLTNDPGLDRGLIRPLNLDRCFQTHELRLEEVDNPLHRVPIPCEENRDACRPMATAGFSNQYHNQKRTTCVG